MSLKVAHQALDGQARTLRHDFEARISSLAANLREMSSNALIANALADDIGRTVYLRDFLGGISSLEGFKVTVVMTNFQGEPLASNRPASKLLLPSSWIAGVVDTAQGKGRVELIDEVPYLLLAQPIIYRNTGMAEGALVFQVNLQDWLNFEFIHRTFDEEPWLSALSLKTEEVAATPVKTIAADGPSAQLTLSMPQNVDGVSLSIKLVAKQAFVQTPLDELLTNVAGTSAAVFIVALLGSFLMSRWQTRKLSRLREEAVKISQLKMFDVSFTSDGQDEVDDLAEAFTTLVDELQQAYRQLADESQREIEQRERRFQSIINNSAEGIITLSNKGIIETFNPSAEQIFGYTAAEAIGHNISILMPENERAAHDSYLKHSDLHAPRIINRSRDLLGLRKSGRTFPLELNVSPMELDGEHKFIGIMRDISERKHFEDRLNAARIEAEQANLAKSQFLSSMSHELRTPLNAILGFGQLLEMETANPLTQAQQNAVGQILKGGYHLLELIDQVLNLAKIESGNLTVSIEAIDVAGQLIDALTMAQSMADKRNIHLEYDIPDPQTMFVYADHTRLQQILLNLLSNAAKYNRESGAIYLRCHAVGELCRFEVEDTGLGIDEDLHDEVFAPFNRLGAESSDIEGTGIGLTITQELVHLMGGTIGFTSTVGKGSLFWFELPLASTEENLQRLKQAYDIGVAPGEQDDGEPSRKILYVEDNPANLQLMEMILDNYDRYELISAHTAELGIALAESDHPDVILMDIHLPGMNGIDAMRSLRRNPLTKQIPIIAISANAMEKDIQFALDAGFDNYLTKPLNIPDVLKALTAALRSAV
ncbi:PAS domain S-box protein [Magnetovibrio sp.]|uniref:PAS domain S-box protein n=1 Tax=Magnetovibrio sp. TaxID=2024836 RepID=UPI002F95DEE9